MKTDDYTQTIWSFLICQQIKEGAEPYGLDKEKLSFSKFPEWISYSGVKVDITYTPSEYFGTWLVKNGDQEYATSSPGGVIKTALKMLKSLSGAK